MSLVECSLPPSPKITKEILSLSEAGDDMVKYVIVPGSNISLLMVRVLCVCVKV